MERTQSGHTRDVLADLRIAMERLRTLDPVKLTRRGTAALTPSAYLERGQVVRVMSAFDDRPLIVMNADDVAELVAEWRSGGGYARAWFPDRIEQEIADVYEEEFARRERAERAKTIDWSGVIWPSTGARGITTVGS